MVSMQRALGLGLALALAPALALPGCAHEARPVEHAGAGGEAKATKAAADTAANSASGAAAPAAAAATAAAGAEYGPQNLLDPKGPLMNETAPDVYRARFETTAGAFEIQVTRAWSPNGADRFYNLVRNGFFDDTYFFRAMAGFMAQFGLPADPTVGAAWTNASIKDDPAVGQSNKRGMVTFAKTGAPHSRSTQIFINFVNNAGLDAQGFTPFGQVAEGMESVDAIFTGYGDGPPGGMGPDQGRVRQLGSPFLAENYGKLTRIERARIVGN
jgi:peptidyl-prolyl cis-trans isomerase A (cyclophilin A)